MKRFEINAFSMEEAKAKAQGVLAKKPAFGKKEKDGKNNSQATEAAAPQENK